MGKQQVMDGIRLPVWKRLILVTVLLFSAEPLVGIVSSQAAHANSLRQNSTTGLITYIPLCNGGLGGHGGVGSTGGIVTGSEAGGGPGGDCLIYGNKEETGGAFSGASGGNSSFGP